MKRALAIFAALSLTGCAAVLDWIQTETNPPTPASCKQTGCPDGFECQEWGQCLPKPSPSPVPTPTPTPVPSPTPVPLPSPPWAFEVCDPAKPECPSGHACRQLGSPEVWACLPTPVPSPSPCASPKPPCLTKDGLPASNCVSCAEFLVGSIRSGDLVLIDPEREILTNGRDFVSGKDCWVIYRDGTRKADRFRNDGSVCKEGCSKEPPVPCASPSHSPSPSPLPSPGTIPPNLGADDPKWCQLQPGARNWPLFPGSDKLKSEGGVCPTCWSEQPGQIISRCGVKHKATQSRNGGAGRRYIFDVTCHSDAPRCPHRADQRSCDVLWACQPPEPALYQTFEPLFTLARVDRVSHNPYLGQIHISDPAENGWYLIHACPPGIRPDGPGGEVCESLSLYVGTDGDLK